MNKPTLIPAQLFIGQEKILVEKTERLLKENFCSSNTSDCFCVQCRKIKNNQHENIIWIEPEKDYTIKDIAIIFEKINFALDEQQKFFFILAKAHTLNLACANKLLKVLEEPPAGYNFILHTNNTNSILPTIISRCLLVNFGQTDADTIHPITSFFYNKNFDSPDEFDKELKKTHLSDSQSIELADNMTTSFTKQIIKHYKGENVISDQAIKYTEKVLEYLKEKMKQPPQSGSSNLFWKNLYISFPRK